MTEKELKSIKDKAQQVSNNWFHFTNEKAKDYQQAYLHGMIYVMNALGYDMYNEGKDIVVERIDDR